MIRVMKMTSIKAATSADFVDSIGVNIHLSYTNTAYGNFDRVQQALDYLGVHHVRDIITKSSQQLDRIDALMAKDYDFNFMIPPDLGTIDEQIARMKPRAAHISTIEGPNEDDITEFHIYNGKGFPEGTRMMQTDLFNKVNADSVLGKSGYDIPVIGPSLARGGSYATLGDLSKVSDYANTHSYFSNGSPPGASRDSNHKEGDMIARGRTPIATEGGYHTADAINSGNLGVTPEVHGKYMTRFLLEQYTHGWERTYVYELFDMKNNPAHTERESNWGLFDFNGNAKPAAKGIANMITLLEDTDTRPMTTGSLDYTLKGMPSNGDDLLLQKHNGKYYLVLWNDADNWDEKADRPISYGDQQVTLSLGSAAEKVAVYRPLTNGTTAVSSFDKVQDVKIGLPDHPVIVEITPGKGGPITVPPTDPHPVPPNTTDDTVSVIASGDQYQGAPTMVFRVDGKEVFRTDVTGVHKTGGWQTYNWTSKEQLDGHKVEVGFVNDLYGGSTSADRNLWLKTVKVGSDVLLNSETNLASNGSKAFVAPKHDNSPTTPPVEIGSKVTVMAAGDVYKGAPHMVFRVDGKEVFSTDVSVTHASGKWAEFTWTSKESLDGHKLDIAFTNDLYAGSPAADRNLWIKSIAVDDDLLMNKIVNMHSNSVQSFTVPDDDAPHLTSLVGVAHADNALLFGA
jgi:hypothetical protein